MIVVGMYYHNSNQVYVSNTNHETKEGREAQSHEKPNSWDQTRSRGTCKIAGPQGIATNKPIRIPKNGVQAYGVYNKL